ETVGGAGREAARSAAPPAAPARGRGRRWPRLAPACCASGTAASTRRGGGRSCRLGLDDPERAVGAVEALGAVDLHEAARGEPDARAVALEDRAPARDRRHEVPGTHLAVDVRGSPLAVDEAVVVLEAALVLPALLGLAAVPALDPPERDRDQLGC